MVLDLCGDLIREVAEEMGDLDRGMWLPVDGFGRKTWETSLRLHATRGIISSFLDGFRSIPVVARKISRSYIPSLRSRAPL